MKLSYQNPKTGGECHLHFKEPLFDRNFYGKDRKSKLLTIAWNTGPDQKVTIDGIIYQFASDTVLCLMVNQSFRFEEPDHIIAWQFNREFYCIVDHDREVSCVGLLFHGTQVMFVSLNTETKGKLDLLFRIFVEEFETVDNIQHDMLQMLLKRLIILTTRLARAQYLPSEGLNDQKLDIIRHFNLLVENHYKKEHRVSFYASELNRSPKTLANVFALYGKKSPLSLIQERILLEARRLLLYTDKSAKEIAYEIGFEDMAYFSNFFKKMTGQPPSDFRRNGISKSPV